MTRILAGAFALLAISASACRHAEVPAREATPAATQTAPVLYVDVRTPEEFASGHVEGALNIPHDQMEARWQELVAHTRKPLVLYCRSGRRSGLALDVLKQKGFTQATNGGGLDDLVKRGVPVRR